MSFLTRSFFTKGTKIFMDYAYWKPFQIIDFFRDRLTELSFSCFIAYTGENYEAVKQYNEWHRNAIYATMFLANPSILFSAFGDYFFYDPVISGFVKNNKYLWGVLEAIMQLKKEGKELTEMQSILTYLSSMPPFSFIANIISSIIQKPLSFYAEWVEHIYSFVVKAQYDFVSACSEILSEFNKRFGETVVYALKPQIVVLICPWIYYLFPTIISHIRLNHAYSIVEPKKGRPTLKGSIFKYLLAELYFDDKYVESKPTMSDGTIVFTMPKAEYEKMYPREITINVMGLKTTYFVRPPEFPRLVLYDANTNLWIPTKQSNRCKPIKEDDPRENYIVTYVFEEHYDWDWDDAKVVVLDEGENYHLEIYKGEAYDPHRWFYDENIIVDLPQRHELPYELFAHVIVEKTTKNLVQFWRE